MTEAENRVPSFEIPIRPERRYSRTTVEYAGAVVFRLTPPVAVADDRLEALLLAVLDAEPYRYGDWLDLPMPLFLVHDDDTGDTFRVAVRDGTVELHVLPETEPAGLRGLYDRLVAAWADAEGAGGEDGWRVDRRVDPPD